MKREPKQVNCEICDKLFIQHQIPRVCSFKCAAERKRRREAEKPPNLKLNPVYKMPKGKTDHLQIVINKISLLIDAELLCPVTHKNASDAGHLYTRSAHPEMRYNLHNIHRQSRQSNGSHNDDIKFRDAIAKEYGSEYVEFVESCRKTPVIGLTESERKQIEVAAMNWLFRLQSNPKYYDSFERIDIRNIINECLGIYPKEFCVYEVRNQD